MNYKMNYKLVLNELKLTYKYQKIHFYIRSQFTKKDLRLQDKT